MSDETLPDLAESSAARYAHPLSEGTPDSDETLHSLLQISDENSDIGLKHPHRLPAVDLGRMFPTSVDASDTVRSNRLITSRVSRTPISPLNRLTTKFPTSPRSNTSISPRSPSLSLSPQKKNAGFMHFDEDESYIPLDEVRFEAKIGPLVVVLTVSHFRSEARFRCWT